MWHITRTERSVEFISRTWVVQHLTSSREINCATGSCLVNCLWCPCDELNCSSKKTSDICQNVIIKKGNVILFIFSPLIQSYTLWHYRLLSFKIRDKKLERFLHSILLGFLIFFLFFSPFKLVYFWIESRKMVFCYHNCSNVLWEKIVLVWGKKLIKKFANSRP